MEKGGKAMEQFELLKEADIQVLADAKLTVLEKVGLL